MNLNDSSQDVVVWPEKLDSEEKIVEQLKKNANSLRKLSKIEQGVETAVFGFLPGKEVFAAYL